VAAATNSAPASAYACPRTEPGTGWGQRPRDASVQPLQRFAEQRTVDLFLAREVAVDGARRVARSPCDLAHAGAVQAEFEERRARGGQHVRALHVGDGALARTARRHRMDCTVV